MIYLNTDSWRWIDLLGSGCQKGFFLQTFPVFIPKGINLVWQPICLSSNYPSRSVSQAVSWGVFVDLNWEQQLYCVVPTHALYDANHVIVLAFGNFNFSFLFLFWVGQQLQRNSQASNYMTSEGGKKLNLSLLRVVKTETLISQLKSYGNSFRKLSLSK